MHLYSLLTEHVAIFNNKIQFCKMLNTDKHCYTEKKSL